MCRNVHHIMLISWLIIPTFIVAVKITPINCVVIEGFFFSKMTLH